MTLSPRTIARSIFRWAWLSCISSALRRTRFMCGSNPSRIPRYPRPPFSSTITFELIRWLRRESGLIIGPRRSHGGGVLKGLREARGRRDSHRPSRIPMSPLPFILAAVSLRRIDQKTGIAEDVHADDHVVSHVLPIGDGDRDLEFPASDHDAGIDDVSFFRLVRRGRPNADAVEHGPETRTRREVRVEARPGRAGVDSRQHVDVALTATEGDLFDDADCRPFLSLPPLGDHGVHRQLPSLYRYTSRDIALTARISDSTRFSPANRIASFSGVASDEDRGDFEETHLLVHQGHPEVDPRTRPRARIREDRRGTTRRRRHGRRGVQRQVVAVPRHPDPADRPLDDGLRQDAVAPARANGHPDDAD